MSSVEVGSSRTAVSWPLTEEGRIRTQPGKIAIAGEGLFVDLAQEARIASHGTEDERHAWIVERHGSEGGDRRFRRARDEEGGPDYVPPAERVAVFDNDGTLWCEKPMPIELGFILRGWPRWPRQDASLRERQPWKAAYEQDYAWLGGAITKHYQGDDSDVKVLMGGILQAFAGADVEDYAAAADAFLHGGQHPTLGRAFHECGYQPMVELLRYLEANGFTSYIASGGDRDFMRPGHRGDLRHPAGARDRQLERAALPRRRARRHGRRTGRRARRLRRRSGQAGPDLEPDRPAADPRRRQLERRHPDAPLRRRQARPALRLLVLHDDAEREFDYTAGAEQALERAAARAGRWSASRTTGRASSWMREVVAFGEVGT